MNILTIDDLNQIFSLAMNAKCERRSVNHIKKFITSRKKSLDNKELTENEIKILSTDHNVKIFMILFFLTKNVALEFLRRVEMPYPYEVVVVKQIWNNIESILKRKMVLSREISSYFELAPEEFHLLLSAAKEIKIDDISSEEFINNQDNSMFRLYITGKYKFVGDISSREAKQELYTLHDRKTCFHLGLYDPFKFEESQTWTSYRYLNTSPTRQLIDSVFTVKFALPELTVLNNDGTFIKIQAKDIPDFLETHLQNNEIDADLYQAVRTDYPQLFLPLLDLKTLNIIYEHVEQLIIQSFHYAFQVNKPLLILLSEVHGSKESFLFHILIVSIANHFGIKHLLAETINIYHEQYGWDAQVAEIKRLLSFAQEKLGFQVKDLEGVLHYNNRLCPYPYHDIPEQSFGIDTREASWIIDAEEIKENKIMIVGSGHLNNLLKSTLKENYHILPIDCTGDKAFSDMLAISQHNFISLDKNVNHLSLDGIINMVERLK